MKQKSAIITGDIINSRELTGVDSIEVLRGVLCHFGSEPANWHIYRGDSFQLEVPVADALVKAYAIKAALKQDEVHDIRMGIGIGEVTLRPENITHAQGSALIHSGAAFEALDKATLLMATGNESWDHNFNLIIELFNTHADHWTGLMAQVVHEALMYPNKTQAQIAETLNKSQGAISEVLKRASYEQLKKVLAHYNEQIKQI